MRKIITRSIGFLLCAVVAILPVYASMNNVETIKINNDDTALIDTAQQGLHTGDVPRISERFDFQE